MEEWSRRKGASGGWWREGTKGGERKVKERVEAEERCLGRWGGAESLGGSQAALSVSVAAQSGLLSPWPRKPSLLPSTASRPEHAGALLSSRVHLVLSSSHTRTFIWIWHTCEDSIGLLNPRLCFTLFTYRLVAWSCPSKASRTVCGYNEDKLGYSGMPSFGVRVVLRMCFSWENNKNISNHWSKTNSYEICFDAVCVWGAEGLKEQSVAFKALISLCYFGDINAMSLHKNVSTHKKGNSLYTANF